MNIELLEKCIRVQQSPKILTVFRQKDASNNSSLIFHLKVNGSAADRDGMWTAAVVL